jgi:hypothetical protein
VDATAAAGFVFFTIDPSGAVDQQADSYSESELRAKFAAVRGSVPWYDTYLNRSFQLPGGTQVVLDEHACMRAAVKYGAAIAQAISLSNHIRHVQDSAGRDHEIELSVDETDQPTTLAEHWIIADQCRAAGMRLVSLRPGLSETSKRAWTSSATSQHSNDRLPITPPSPASPARINSACTPVLTNSPCTPCSACATAGLFHVKTAGTSYLEALRVAARCDEQLFRRIIDFARSVYDRDKATYHVSATLESAPPQQLLASAKDLERQYLELWDEVPEGRGFTKPGRQILHCTFGSTLRHPQLGQELRAILQANPDTYTEVLADHFGRHLRPLQAGL